MHNDPFNLDELYNPPIVARHEDPVDHAFVPVFMFASILGLLWLAVEILLFISI
jgi:hypothetical protein